MILFRAVWYLDRVATSLLTFAGEPLFKCISDQSGTAAFLVDLIGEFTLHLRNRVVFCIELPRRVFRRRPGARFRGNPPPFSIGMYINLLGAFAAFPSRVVTVVTRGSVTRINRDSEAHVLDSIPLCVQNVYKNFC